MDSIGRELPTTVDLQLAAWDRTTFSTLIFCVPRLMTPFLSLRKNYCIKLTWITVCSKTIGRREKLLNFTMAWKRMLIFPFDKLLCLCTYRSVIYFLSLMRGINHGCLLLKSFHVIMHYLQNKQLTWEISFIVFKMDLLSLSHTVYSGCTQLDFNHVKWQYFLLILSNTTIRRINLIIPAVTEQKIKKTIRQLHGLWQHIVWNWWLNIFYPSKFIMKMIHWLTAAFSLNLFLVRIY